MVNDLIAQCPAQLPVGPEDDLSPEKRTLEKSSNPRFRTRTKARDSSNGHKVAKTV